MAKGNSAKNLRAEDFLVNPDERPGWVRATERMPLVGDSVYCAGGEGVVSSVHGRTGDGSRLLQIRLDGASTPSFFAAASNVLVKPA